MKFLENYKGYDLYLTECNTYIINNRKREYKTIRGARQGISHLISDVNTNEYILYDDYAEIVITSKKFGIFKTQIDLDDVDKCKQIVWNINRCYHHKDEEYYIGSSNEDATLLHRFLMGNPKDLNVDHVDGKTFNNRKYNLRICTRMENAKNRKMNRNNSSGIKGVSYNKKYNNWVAHASRNGKKITIGNYECLDDAIEARKEFEDWYHGEFKREIVELI